MDVLEQRGEGYRRLVEGPKWTVAGLNYAARFDEANFVRVERHLLTDEAFVLVRGDATLVYGDALERVRMCVGKVYNVKAGEWHHIFVKPGSNVLVFENSDTGKDNTEYRNVK